MTAGETALTRATFGNAIDTDRVRIHHMAWFLLQPREVVMAPDGHIWCHPKGRTWSEDFSIGPTAGQGLFVHEMTHVWQSQRGGRWFLPLARHPFCRYSYRFDPNRPFERYGLEQQAELVRHAYLLRKGVEVPGKPPLSAYLALLPFD